MAAAALASPASWALALSVMVVVAFVLYQALGYRLLSERHRRLCALRAGQRQVYRRLGALQSRSDVLVAGAPVAVRPAPYTADDERAIALRAELMQRLEALRGELRPLQVGRRPRPSPAQVLSGTCWSQLRAVEREVAFAERQRRALARAEATAGELEAVLAEIAGKPLQVRQRFADLHILATALAQDVEREQERGTEGLVPLVFQAQALRSTVVDWVERLRAAETDDAAQAAIAAEAERPQLAARLMELRARAQSIAGLHDQALEEQARLDQTLLTIEARLACLRPALAAVLRPALTGLQEERGRLGARYDAHDAVAYHEVAHQAWGLAARVRALGEQVERLLAADAGATRAVEECRQALAELQAQVQQEARQSRAELDLSGSALRRVERSVARLENLWSLGPDARPPADFAAAMTLLGRVEALAQRCRQEEAAARQALAAWRERHKRVHEVLARLQGSAAEHERLAQAWRELQRYQRTNWAHLDADWHDAYAQARQEILQGVAQIQETVTAGRVVESTAAELLSQAEALEERWQRLLHEGQRVTAALVRVQAAQRQVLEGLAALRPEVQTVARIAEELPADLETAAELRELSGQILTAYRDLEDQATHPERADLRRLCDEDLGRLHEQLAMHRLAHARLLDNERADLKHQLSLLWEQWEPLYGRLAKAVPASSVDHRGLARQWESLLRRPPASLGSLRQVLDAKAHTRQFARDLAEARNQFDAERTAVREMEESLAHERRAATELRECVPRLLGYPHPQVVDEEWERSDKAWSRSETLLRHLEPHRGVQPYLSRLAEALALYQEARSRARSALVRLLRYAFLEDPDGMHEACQPLGRRWARVGVTAREEHIRELLDELERAGQVARLVERVEGYLAGRGTAG